MESQRPLEEFKPSMKALHTPAKTSFVHKEQTAIDCIDPTRVTLASQLFLKLPWNNSELLKSQLHFTIAALCNGEALTELK